MMMNINKKIITIFIMSMLATIYLSSLSSSIADNIITDDLHLQLRGYIIIDNPSGGINTIKLPSNKDVIRKSCIDTSNPISALSGPDNRGRIAFIDSDSESKTYSLKLISVLTRKETEVFTRKGSYWSHEKENYGKSFSLSNNGGLVAFVRNFKADFTLLKNDYINIGNLEIVNTEKMATIKTDIKIIDKGTSWLPDGQKLVYVALMARDKINKNLVMKFEDDFASEMTTWHSIPVVVILNLTDMSTKQLHIGWNPIVSQYGTSVLIQDNKGLIRLYRFLSGDSIPIKVPVGEQCHVFSFIGKDFLLYKTIPDENRKYRMTSTFGRTPYWTLRIAKINSSEFKTIIQDLDIHRRVSFGEVKK